MSWSDAGRVLLLGVLLVLAGCGFRLRGDPEFPEMMALTYLDSVDEYSIFYQKLTTALRRSGITLTGSAADATAILRIRSDATGARVLSVSARNVPTEYEIFYTVEFSLTAAGQEVLAPERLTLTRDYTYDETRVLGKATEEQNLRAALADDLVGLVSRRLSAAR